MLSVQDLADELSAVANKAVELAGVVKGNGDLPARTLAGGVVEVAKIAAKLEKVGKHLAGGNGKKK